MSLEVRLDAFEGPLDLLLALIEKNKVDIYDIPIALIADQYMEYVEVMKDEKLDILSDFLVMASTLLDIKARMLLPREEDENGEEIDPRTELVERLIEYQEYRMMAEELKVQYSGTEGVYYKGSTLPKEVLEYEPEPDLDELLSGVTLQKLQAAFELVIRRQEEKVDPIRSRFGNIKRDAVRISDKLTFLLDFGQKKKKFGFTELFEDQKTRADVVVTFLACLELIRCGQIFVKQDDNFGNIDFEWNGNCDRKLSKEDIKQYD